MSLSFTLWNMEDGFVDGLLRGWRSTFLTDAEYANLKEGGKRGGGGGGGGGAPGGASAPAAAKEDFEDMRLSLQETDYGAFLAAEPALDPKLIGLRATGKWVRELRYARASATGALARFLDFVAYEYMIDNILDLIKAATSSQTVDAQAVVAGCHPLGARGARRARAAPTAVLARLPSHLSSSPRPSRARRRPAGRVGDEVHPRL